MNKEELNNIMNCQCLQSIIQKDMDYHTFDDSVECNRGRLEPKYHNKQIAEEGSHIIQTCRTSYRNQKFEKSKYGSCAYLDRLEEDYKNIPYLYCPICGTKSKLDITKESFYHNFQRVENE